MMIQIEKPTLRRRDMSAVLQTMVDEHIGPGENSKAFLSSLNEYLENEGYSIAFRSFADSLYYALKSLNLKEDGVIGVSALSPKIYEYVINRLGYSVHIFDIDAETKSINVDHLSTHLNSLDALLIYEPYGVLTPSLLFEIADIPIIVDITQTIGCADEEYRCGSKGDILILSFEQGDLVSTGGGGALLFRHQGSETSIIDEITQLYPYIGLSDMNSSLGIIQLANVEQDLIKRRAIYTNYQLASSQNSHSSFASLPIDYQMNGYSFLMILESKVSQAIAFAKKYDVSCQLAFCDTIINDQLDAYETYPNAIPVIQRTIRFPLYPFLLNKEIRQVEKVISQIP